MLSSLLFNMLLEVLARAIQEEKKIFKLKNILKVSMFSDDIIMYVESTKDYTNTYTQNLLKLYKFRIQS